MASSAARSQTSTQCGGSLNWQLAEELAHANAELEAFAYSAAHDLREPLRTVRNLTQLLVRNAKLDPEDKETATQIVNSIHRLSEVVDELLFAAVHGFAASLHIVELERVVAHAVENLREAVVESRAVITVGCLPILDGREVDLTRLFQNLISNAIKYRRGDGVAIRITAECSGAGWIIKVQDNGIGIEREDQRRIFGLFSRGGEKVEGTGIGLAVCKRIVESLGGTIWVESEVGVGSTFCFTLSAAVTGRSVSFADGRRIKGNQ